MSRTPRISAPNAGRRAFLRHAALGTLALSLPTFPGYRARAQAAIPKRIVFFYGSGMLYNDWAPVGTSGGAPTETDWTPGLVHAPLTPFKKDLIYMDGIGMVSEEIDPGPKGDAHSQGAKHALSAANTTGTTLPGGISIDQLIAQRINAPAPVTRFPSLELQVTNWTNELTLYSNATASGKDQPLPGIWDPRQAYQRVFGDFVPPDSSMADALHAQQTAMFGLAQDDFRRLLARVGKTDRERIQTHLDLVNDLQKRLGVTSASCTKPAAPVLQRCDFACYNEKDSAADTRNWQLAAQHHVDLIVASLACDLTRVAFLELGYGADDAYGYKLGDFDTTDMHDLIHKVNDPGDALSKNAQARGMVQKQCLLEAQALADLLTKLAGITEADGTRLLDNTLVLYCGQIAYGDHNLSRLPWVIAGNADGYFKTGRYIKYPKNPQSTRGLPHNNLFVSLANAMGVDITTFGNPACCTGPLDKLRG